MDWYCKTCNFKIYGHKNKCSKCGEYRKDGKRSRPGDWTCKGCGFLLFADKEKCWKCNMDRHGNYLTEKKEEKEGDGDKCIICVLNEKNAVFLHGESGHQVCCFGCASRVKNQDGKCPLCRERIDKVVRIY